MNDEVRINFTWPVIVGIVVFILIGSSKPWWLETIRELWIPEISQVPIPENISPTKEQLNQIPQTTTKSDKRNQNIVYSDETERYISNRMKEGFSREFIVSTLEGAIVINEMVIKSTFEEVESYLAKKEFQKAAVSLKEILKHGPGEKDRKKVETKLEAIFTQYLEQAKIALIAEDIEKALSFISVANTIKPGDDRIIDMKLQIAQFKDLTK